MCAASLLSVCRFSVRVLIAVLFSPFRSPAWCFCLYSQTNTRKQARASLYSATKARYIDRPNTNTTALQFPQCASIVAVSFCSVLCLSFVMVIVNSKSPHSWPRNNFMPHNITQPHTLKTSLIPGAPPPVLHAAGAILFIFRVQIPMSKQKISAYPQCRWRPEVPLGNGLTLKPRGDPAPENYDLVTPKMTGTSLTSKQFRGAICTCGYFVFF